MKEREKEWGDRAREEEWGDRGEKMRWNTEKLLKSLKQTNNQRNKV